MKYWEAVHFFYCSVFATLCIHLDFVASVDIPYESVNLNLPGSKENNNNYSQKTIDTFMRYNRQLDSDVESRFHITPNTIIRTGESRILGARYINETILPSNHDCLTWCLETPNCNAAVYEEKDAQSCYMFNCGVSAALCTFTSHSFFISSVLKFTQHSYDLSQWGNQVRHEQELAQLRNSDPLTQSTTISTVEPKKITSTTIGASSIPAVTESPCHHYQFKCLNSSECIAIYNVCDGIPQCPDESDESVDLKCHEKEIKSIPPKIEKPAEPKISNIPPRVSENRIPGSNLRTKIPQVASAVRKNPMNNREPPPNINQQRQDIREDNRHGSVKSIWSSRPASNQALRKEYYPHTEDRTNAGSDGLGSPFKHMHSKFVAANDPHVQSLNRWSNDYDQYPSHSVALDQEIDGGNYPRLEDQYNPSQLSPDYDSIKEYKSFRQEDIPFWNNRDASFPIDAEYPQPHMHSMNKQASYPDKERLYAQQLARTADQYPEIKHHIMHKPPDPIPEIPSQNRSPDLESYKSQRISLQRQPPYLAYDDSLPKQLYRDLKLKNYPSRIMDGDLEDWRQSSDDLIRESLVNQLPIEPDHSYSYNMKNADATSKPEEEENHES